MSENATVWKPNVTVAAIIERDGKFLLVEEETGEGVRFNQPAGHLEAGESLIAAVIRETLEESGRYFEPRAMIGIYHYRHAASNITYLRFAFSGVITGRDKARKLDTGVIRALWLTPQEINASRARHRTPIVAQCIEDYLAGVRYPIDLIHHSA